MLAVVGRVLQAVHAGVFKALGSPEAPGPGGFLTRRDWDVRAVLHEQRMQVGAQASAYAASLICACWESHGFVWIIAHLSCCC